MQLVFAGAHYYYYQHDPHCSNSKYAPLFLLFNILRLASKQIEVGLSDFQSEKLGPFFQLKYAVHSYSPQVGLIWLRLKQSRYTIKKKQFTMTRFPKLGTGTLKIVLKVYFF